MDEQRARLLRALAGVFWLVNLVYIFASGEYREHSTMRNGTHLMLFAFSVFVLWDYWRTRDAAS